MANFLVIGLNAMGRTLARELARRGATVTVADASESRVSRIKNDVKHAVVIDSTDRAALGDLHLEKFDHVVVCMGHQFEASELTTLALRDVGARFVTAVATTRQRKDILKALGAYDVVTPGIDKARNLAVELAEAAIHSYVYLDQTHGIADLVLTQHLDVGEEWKSDLMMFGVRFVAFKRKAASGEEPAYDFEGVVPISLGKGDRILLFGTPDDIVKAAKKKL